MHRPHRLQWIISKHAQRIWPEWKTLSLPSGLILSHCAELRVVATSDRTRVLIGDPIETANESSEPEIALSSIRGDNLRTVTDGWAGRWVVITENQIYQDVGSLMAVFYSDAETSQRLGGVVASSSPALLCAEIGIAPDRTLPAFSAITHPPLTPFRGILRLYGSRSLDLATGETQLTPERPFARLDVTTLDVVTEGARIIRTVVEKAAQRGGATAPLLIALSGGADSRRNLAAAAGIRDNVRAFTFYKPWLYSSRADSQLPTIVAKAAKISHTELSSRAFDRERAEALLTHAGSYGYSIPGGDYYYFTRGYWAALGDLPRFVDGQAYELGANYYYHNFAATFRQDAITMIPISFAASRREEVEETWAFGMSDLPADRRDMLFWTANINASYGSLYQRSDLFADAIVPANCRRLYSLFLSADPQERDQKRLQNAITVALMPELASIPINISDSRVEYAIRRFWHRAVSGQLPASIANKLRQRLG